METIQDIRTTRQAKDLAERLQSLNDGAGGAPNSYVPGIQAPNWRRSCRLATKQTWTNTLRQRFYYACRPTTR